MSGVRFVHISMFYLLWVIPVLLMIFIYGNMKKSRALREFADIKALSKININVDITRRRWKIVFVLLGAVFIVLALVRPAWNPKPVDIRSMGRDVVFVVDVSRSMLAEDIAPNRLERSKIAILDTVEQLSGDRVALVAFSGTTAVKCPLTLDYGFFRSRIEALGTDSIARGGTMIGDAIRKVIDDVYDDFERQFKDVILITDGEDHDSFPVQAAEEAGRQGVRLIAIGLGDENEGKRIPITDEFGNKTFLTYNNQEIWSRLDADTLREMVHATPGGKYLNVSTGTFDLGKIYMQLIASAEKRELEAKTVERYEEKFQIFMALAFVFLLLDYLITERKKKSGGFQRNG